MSSNRQPKYSHPISELLLDEMNHGTWNVLHPPDLMLPIGDDFVSYMPQLPLLEIKSSICSQPAGDGRFMFLFSLTNEPEDLAVFLPFFDQARGAVEAKLQGSTLALVCHTAELALKRDEVASALYRAYNDYNEERHRLVWAVFMDIKDREHRRRIEDDIRAELENFRKERQGRIDYANTHPFSASFMVQNYVERYREILENKFVWWAKVLNEKLIQKYRAEFELEMTSV